MGGQNMQDLAGVVVVSLEQAVAAPYASSRLADAGARVIKVERPEGDFARNYDSLVEGHSAYFVWLNRGKESICLDLKDAGDRQVMEDLVARADVFIQNLVSGAAARLGLGAEDLCRKYPGLICCSIFGYGSEGPYRDQNAYDMLIQGESGLLAVNGTADESVRVGISVCDITAGMNAYAAILQALIAREKTGQGRAIEVSLFHAIADWMNVPYLQTRYGGQAPQRLGLRHPSIAPYGAFTCSDGKQVLLSIQNEREWARFCAEVLKDPGIAVDERFASNILRVRNLRPLEDKIAAVFATLDREAAISLLSASGIACGRLSEMHDLIAHPQRRLISVDAGSDTIEMLAPGVQVVGRNDTFGPVPGLGEHGAAIREELRKPARTAG